jgi:short-subunit dehydrogenase
MNAIITGGTKGIGRAIAELYASKGIDLAICSRSEEDLTTMQKNFTDKYPSVKVITKACDVRDRGQLESFAAFVKESWEHIDILINNAGVFYPGILLEEKDDALAAMIETNLYSAYHLTRAIVPVMLPKKKGLIVNMCSIASKIAYPNGGSYSISKFALLGFSKVLREELKESGIKVTSILPGATWSHSWEGVDLPKDRLMEANDIAEICYTLISLSPSAVLEEIILRPQLGDL